MDIEDLYALIPEFMCTPGCHECCKNFGVPSRTRVEDERIKAFIDEQALHTGQAQGKTCPYLNENGCSIYPVRPLICRLYGNAPNYQCKMDVAPLRMLHEDEEAEIFYFYQKNFF